MSLLPPVATVGGLTLASRVLGFIRDIAFAAILGTGPTAEAFFVAFRLPNLFRSLFAEGAFNVAFVPIFTRILKGGGPERARDFAEEALSALATTLLALVLLAQLLMPWLIYGIAGGFADRPEVFAQSVVFSRIAFPYLLFISLAALFGGMLNALGRFAAAAAAPILLNLVMIGALAWSATLSTPAGLAVSWGVPLAGILQLLLVAGAARRAGMGLRLRRPRLGPDGRRLLTVAAPAALTSGVYQLHLLISTLVASFFPGAVAWLQYADRLYQLPLGVVGVALSVVLLPELARRLEAGDTVEARNSFSRSLETALAVSVPSAVALAAVPVSLIGTLFERGAFGPADTAITASALALFAVGLPAFMLAKIYASVFFAHEDTRRPLYYAGTGFALNALLAAGGAPIWGFLAIPAATSISAWFALALFIRGARRLKETKPDAAFRRRAPRAVAAALAMGAIILAAELAMAGMFADPILRYLALVLLVAGGLVSYGVIGHFCGGLDLAAIRQMMRRGRGQT